MKGYKVFNSDWTCREFQYKVGETYKLPEGEEPQLCKHGFHFCTELIDCFSYYPFSSNIKIAEVEALGQVVTYVNDINSIIDSKHCTNKIKILKEIPLKDLEIVHEHSTFHKLVKNKIPDLEEHDKMEFIGPWFRPVFSCKTRFYRMENENGTDFYHYISEIEFFKSIRIKNKNESYF